ncbi:MAG: lipid-A-disaccharide synthase [candidate division Zixibacteria bacterium]|nr:lipid-A-disaccharide synthase [candidate division Zixibacteria bacterium]
MTERIPVFISAGDPSGDIAGSHLIHELAERNPQLTFIGLGGDRMGASGQTQVIDGSELAVLGFWEVARKFTFFKKLLHDTVAMIERERPGVIILIDYPGFNLRLAERIKRLGIPIVYYISPQIWAWGGKRIEQIKRLVDLMLLILPFETKLYDSADVPNRFVGHYLLDDMEPAHIKAPYDAKSDLIVLMPGSRPQEVQRMLPTLLETVKKIATTGKYRFVVAGVKGNIDYTPYLKDANITIDVVFGKTRKLVAQSRLVLTSSGTATLETGIIGRPMIILYKTGLLTYLIARRLVKIDHIGLINIAAGESIVPELIQRDATSERIAEQAIRYLTDEMLSADVVGRLHAVVDRLGGPGAAGRAADAIRELGVC